MLKLDDCVYIANTGDSRAIVSMNKGSNVLSMTTDHKPSNELEKKRIYENGGNIYKYNKKDPSSPRSGKYFIKRCPYKSFSWKVKRFFKIGFKNIWGF